MNFSVAGDLSQLFSLPGGPIGFVLGAEYREETAKSEFDALTASGGTFLNAIQPFNPPKLTVKEAYGESLDGPIFVKLESGDAFLYTVYFHLRLIAVTGDFERLVQIALGMRQSRFHCCWPVRSKLINGGIA